MNNKEKIEQLYKCLENVNGLIPFHERCLKDLYAERIRIRKELNEIIERKCYTCVYYDKIMRACYKDFPVTKPVIFANEQDCDNWESQFAD